MLVYLMTLLKLLVEVLRVSYFEETSQIFFYLCVCILTVWDLSGWA